MFNVCANNSFCEQGQICVKEKEEDELGLCQDGCISDNLCEIGKICIKENDEDEIGLCQDGCREDEQCTGENEICQTLRVGSDRGYCFEVKPFTGRIKNIKNVLKVKAGPELEHCILVDFPDPTTFEIFDALMYSNVSMKEYLDDDEDNIVFIDYVENSYVGYGSSIKNVQREDNIIVPCLGEYHQMISENEVFIFKHYNRIGLDHYNKGISRGKLWNVPFSLREKEDTIIQNRIFLLKNERQLKYTTKIENVVIERGLNLYGIPISYVGATPCTDGSSVSVYDDIMSVDIESLGKNKSIDEKISIVMKEEGDICNLPEYLKLEVEKVKEKIKEKVKEGDEVEEVDWSEDEGGGDWGEEEGGGDWE